MMTEIIRGISPVSKYYVGTEFVETQKIIR